MIRSYSNVIGSSAPIKLHGNGTAFPLRKITMALFGLSLLMETVIGSHQPRISRVLSREATDTSFLRSRSMTVMTEMTDASETTSTLGSFFERAGDDKNGNYTFSLEDIAAAEDKKLMAGKANQEVKAVALFGFLYGVVIKMAIGTRKVAFMCLQGKNIQFNAQAGLFFVTIGIILLFFLYSYSMNVRKCMCCHYLKCGKKMSEADMKAKYGAPAGDKIFVPEGLECCKCLYIALKVIGGLSLVLALGSLAGLTTFIDQVRSTDYLEISPAGNTTMGKEWISANLLEPSKDDEILLESMATAIERAGERDDDHIVLSKTDWTEFKLTQETFVPGNYDIVENAQMIYNEFDDVYEDHASSIVHVIVVPLGILFFFLAWGFQQLMKGHGFCGCDLNPQDKTKCCGSNVPRCGSGGCFELCGRKCCGSAGGVTKVAGGGCGGFAAERTSAGWIQAAGDPTCQSCKVVHTYGQGTFNEFAFKTACCASLLCFVSCGKFQNNLTHSAKTGFKQPEDMVDLFKITVDNKFQLPVYLKVYNSMCPTLDETDETHETHETFKPKNLKNIMDAIRDLNKTKKPQFWTEAERLRRYRIDQYDVRSQGKTSAEREETLKRYLKEIETRPLHGIKYNEIYDRIYAHLKKHNVNDKFDADRRKNIMTLLWNLYVDNLAKQKSVDGDDELKQYFKGTVRVIWEHVLEDRKDAIRIREFVSKYLRNECGFGLYKEDDVSSPIGVFLKGKGDPNAVVKDNDDGADGGGD